MTESHSNVLGSNTAVLRSGTWREIWKIWHHLLAQATGSGAILGWPLNSSHSFVSPYLQTDCCHYLVSFVLPFYRGFFFFKWCQGNWWQRWSFPVGAHWIFSNWSIFLKYRYIHFSGNKKGSWKQQAWKTQNKLFNNFLKSDFCKNM